MSRARNRADGDFGDLDITNIGAVSLDSIKGDGDGNTSLAFSGSDVITITTGGTTAMTIDASQNTTLAGTLTAITSLGIGSAVLTEAELELLDGITAGTAAANKAVVLDGSKNIATIGTIGSGAITSSGTIQGTTITATTAFVPDASDGAALGTTALEFSDLFLADASTIQFGADQDVTLTHVADTGILINAASKLQFRDSALSINSSADGQLDIDADTEVEITTALVEISADATIGDDLTLISDASVLGFGVNKDVTLTHVHDTGLLLNGARTIQFNDASQNIGAPSGTKLDIKAAAEIELTATLIDVVGNLAISGDLSLAGDLEVGGSSSVTVSASGAVVPDASDGATLGTASLEFADLFLADGAQILFGVDQDITLTHVADTGLTLTSVATGDNKPIVLQLKSEEDAIVANEVIASIEFAAGDSDGTDGATVAAGIHAIAEGTFAADANATKLVFTTGVSETAAASATAKMTLSSAGVLTTAGAITSGGVVTGSAFTAGSAVLAEAELELLDGLTAGTAIASKVVTTDANIDSSGMRNLTITGELDAATGDFSGVVDVAGTTTVVAITASGLVTANADMLIGGTTPTLTIGDAGAEDAKIVFDGNAQDFHVGLDDSSDDLVIGLGSALGTTPAISIDENVLVTVNDDVSVVGRAFSPTLTANLGSAINLALGNNFLITTTGDVVLTFTNQIAGQSGTLKFVNDSNRAVTAHANVAISEADLSTISATGTYMVSYFVTAASANNTILVSASAILT